MLLHQYHVRTIKTSLWILQLEPLKSAIKYQTTITIFALLRRLNKTIMKLPPSGRENRSLPV